MNRLFNPENKFWNFIAKLADVACMSLLWAICSLPAVTLGPASAAFYGFTMHQVNDTEGGVWKSFFSVFRLRFKKAFVIGLVQLLLSAFFIFDIYAAWQYFTGTNSIFSVVILSFCVCIMLIFLGMMLYIYPILAVFDFPMKKLFADSFVMAVGNLHVTVTLFLLLALAGVGIYFISGLYFFWLGLYIFFSSYFITGVFNRYIGEASTGSSFFSRWKERSK